jgi:hypothetical protein
MKTILVPLLVFLGMPQEGPALRVAEELRRLRSDDVEVRNDATRKLTALGEQARSGLEGLLQDPDVDVRSRALDMVRELHRSARIRSVQEPGKRVTIALQGADLEDGLRRIFEAFGLKVAVQRAEPPVDRTITLNLKNASLWEALDAVVAATGFHGQNILIGRAGEKARELYFAGPYVPKPGFDACTTLGDFRLAGIPTRITVPSGGVSVGAMLILTCTSWSTPKKAKIVDVRIAGRKMLSQEDVTGYPFDLSIYPRTNECIKLLDRWDSDSGVPSTTIGNAAVIKVEGTLLLTCSSPGRDEEVRVPFTIADMPVPGPR